MDYTDTMSMGEKRGFFRGIVTSTLLIPPYLSKAMTLQRSWKYSAKGRHSPKAPSVMLSDAKWLLRIFSLHSFPTTSSLITWKQLRKRYFQFWKTTDSRNSMSIKTNSHLWENLK